MNDEIQALTAACARALPSTVDPAAHPRAEFVAALDALIAAIAREPEFMFDAEGRPAAVAAVRGALPPQEADLLDAILEDVAAELAAHRRALYLALALNREPRTVNPEPMNREA